MSETQYELAEISAAKDHVMDAIERELDKQGVNPYPDGDIRGGSIELIDLADAVIERLIKEGVTIPDTMCDLNGEPAQPGATAGN